MPRFQVSCSVAAEGYIELDAADAAEARRKVLRISPSIDFFGASEMDYSLFDQCADIHVDGVEEVEEEPPAPPQGKRP